MILRVQVKAADFLGGELFHELFRLTSSFHPGLFPYPQVQRRGHAQIPELFRTKMNGPLRLLENHKWIDSGILARRSPAKRPTDK